VLASHCHAGVGVNGHGGSYHHQMPQGAFVSNYNVLPGSGVAGPDGSYHHLTPTGAYASNLNPTMHGSMT